MEDSFWEATYPSYNHEDYISILNNLNNLNKEEITFNNIDRLNKSMTNIKPLNTLYNKIFLNINNSQINKQNFLENLENKLNTKEVLNLLNRSNLEDKTSFNLYTISIFSEEFISNPSLLNLKNFLNYNNDLVMDSVDDNYENNKYISYLHYLNYINIQNIKLNLNYPISYTQVLNSFRGDLNENFLDIETNTNQDILNTLSTVNNFNLRVINPLKLRSTSKNAIVTYSAIQKVFKSRFDEGRSNLRLSDISNSYINYPFISEGKSIYEGLLGKNKENFFTSNNYNTNILKNYTNYLPTYNSLNIYFGNIPFLLSKQSDSSRYLWFD